MKKLYAIIAFALVGANIQASLMNLEKLSIEELKEAIHSKRVEWQNDHLLKNIHYDERQMIEQLDEFYTKLLKSAQFKNHLVRNAVEQKPQETEYTIEIYENPAIGKGKYRSGSFVGPKWIVISIKPEKQIGPQLGTNE
jgi:hypothetical protein